MEQQINFELLDRILVVRLPSDYSLQSAAEQTVDHVRQLAPAEKIGLLMDMTDSGQARDVVAVRDAFRHWRPLQQWVKRYAVLVDSDLHWALTRQVSVFAGEEGFDIRPFKQKAEALDWLAT